MTELPKIIKQVLEGYEMAALWELTEGLDIISFRHFSDKLKKQMENDVTKFVTKNFELLANSGMDMSDIGYDFWLTRNDQTKGFCERGLSDVGKQLTTACKAFGRHNLSIEVY